MLSRCSFFEMKQVRESPDDDFLGVARKCPAWWKGSHYLSLAPSEELLSAVKRRTIFWNEYIELFRDEICNNPKALELLKAIWKYAQSHNVYLVCWEKTDQDNIYDTRCHTIILMELAERLAKEANWSC